MDLEFDDLVAWDTSYMVLVGDAAVLQSTEETALDMFSNRCKTFEARTESLFFFCDVRITEPVSEMAQAIKLRTTTQEVHRMLVRKEWMEYEGHEGQE